MLEFYYDISCPYAYIASERIEALAAARGATVAWKPILLGGVFKAQGDGAGPMATYAPSKARLNLLDMHRQARRWGVSLQVPPSHPQRSVAAMRLLVAAPEAVRPALSHALFRAVWTQGQDLTDLSFLTGLAEAHGVDPALISAQDTKDALRARTHEAIERGIFGVPAIFAGERMWWGVDRLHLLLGHLEGRKVWPRELQGAAEPLEPPTEPVRVRLFHDFSSPFSYLGTVNAQAVVAAHGGVLELVPMLLGAVFHSIGTAMVPMQTFSPAKTRYYARDLAEWARWWGVPFRFTSHFPLRTVTALRCALQEPEVTPHLYRAAWADDLDLGDEEVVRKVLEDAGFDASALLGGCQDPAIKAQLRANTEEAVAIGVCGAPTFVVDRPGHPQVLLWGQDRLPMLGDVLDGWLPDPEA